MSGHTPISFRVVSNI